jgi:hypothetical protein
VQENYIVRIFRRNKQEPYRILGTVEHVESTEQVAFHSLGDLIEFLDLSRRSKRRDGSKEE